MFQKDTFKKLADILPDLKEFSVLSLDGLTEAFDFASITDFLLKNENLVIFLRFDEDIPLSDAYKEILEKFIDKIIETPPKEFPYIEFPRFENSILYNDYRKLYDSRK
uniref:Uncharacterized protein n=1 Tax=Panagrolaimus superbus TaxID=310955 RepID=A0A914YKJ9_9BILA